MAEAALIAGRLAKAAEEFIAEGFLYPLAAKEFRNTAPEHQAEAADLLFPRRRSADGFFVWLQYLIWLEGVLEVLPSVNLTAADVEGIRILRRARSRFLKSHPPCPHCGMPNDASSLRCRDCMKEIRH